MQDAERDILAHGVGDPYLGHCLPRNRIQAGSRVTTSDFSLLKGVSFPDTEPDGTSAAWGCFEVGGASFAGRPLLYLGVRIGCWSFFNFKRQSLDSVRWRFS